MLRYFLLALYFCQHGGKYYPFFVSFSQFGGHCDGYSHQNASDLFCLQGKENEKHKSQVVNRRRIWVSQFLIQ